MSRRPSFDPEDFDLEFEMETGLVIGESRGGYGIALDGSAKDFEEALVAGLEAMEQSKYYPNVFYVNERGNVDLLSVKPRIRKGKIVGASYKTLHGWV